MRYRITLADSIYYTVDDLADAQSEALDHARELTRVVGEPVRVTVHRLGHPVIDDFGRDCTPAFFVGSAVGRIEHRQAFVSWVPVPRTASATGVAVKRRVAA